MVDLALPSLRNQVSPALAAMAATTHSVDHKAASPVKAHPTAQHNLVSKARMRML
jgi:hypothetical protein